MPSFSYSGRRNGTPVDGVLEALNSGAAADELMRLGITPVSIRPARAAPAKAGAGPRAKTPGRLGPLQKFLSSGQVTPVDLMLFSRQIHTLMRAGVPIMRALSGLQESAANPAMRGVLQEVRESLDAGRDLASSLARHPRVFTPFYLAMVRVGEMTGMLEEVFLRLFEHLEFDQFMRQQVKSALRYPSFVMGAMVIAIGVINVFVIPAFAKVFKGFGAELPIMTRILIGASDFTMEYGWMLLVGAVGGGFLFKRWIDTVPGRLAWDRFKLRVPVAGKIVRKATLARFARSFALAIHSGVPIIQAMSVVALTVDNAHIARTVEGMRESIERGESVLRSAITAGEFTPVVLQMIAVGEESGALDDMMEEVAELYQREVEYELKTLGQQIEPILIVFLGVLVMILALGVFLPIWDLGRVALHK